MIHTNVQIINNQTLPDGSVGQCGYLYNMDNMLCKFQNGLSLVKDRSYVLSLWIKSESSKKIAIATGTKVVQPQNVTNEWNRVIIKFVSDGAPLAFTLESGTYYVYKIKLEEGDAVTDWTPAPDDLVEKVKIISEINQSPEQISIKAEKISLEGIVTANEKFKILADGSMEATGGKFSGSVAITGGNVNIEATGDGTGASISNYLTLITHNVPVGLGNNLGDVELKISSGDIRIKSGEYESSLNACGLYFTNGNNPSYMSFDCRGAATIPDLTSNRIAVTGDMKIGGSISANSISANTISGTVNGRTWNWSGQGGQPNWLWGGNDGANMYVWSPSNFSVNYANSSGYANRSAGTDDSRLSGLNKIRCGTLVLGGDRGQGSARVLFYLNEVRSLVGDGNASPYNISIVANNGDGNANGAHVEGVTYIPDSHWAVVFDRSVGTALLRINFAIIYGY